MSSQITSHSRAENSADLLRVVVALGLLVLLASFDGAEGVAVAATPAGNGGIALGHAPTDASSSGLPTP